MTYRNAEAAHCSARAVTRRLVAARARPRDYKCAAQKTAPAMAPEPFQVAPGGRGNVGPGENSPIWSSDVVCLASCPQIKGINPAGSKSPGERPRLVPIRITPDVCAAICAAIKNAVLSRQRWRCCLLSSLRAFHRRQSGVEYETLIRYPASWRGRTRDQSRDRKASWRCLDGRFDARLPGRWDC